MITTALILAALFIVWFSFRYAWWAPNVPNQHPRILMYHMIAEPIPGAKFNGLRVKSKDFERQVAWLKSNQWHFVTVSELMAEWSQLPAKTVAITFDDGFEDNYSAALPILQKYDAKATVYLVCDREQNDWSTKKKEHHNSGELAQVPKLSDTQVQTMVNTGHIEIGAHTVSHANLTALTESDSREEIVNSKNALEKQFGIVVSSFAYPFGIYNKSHCQQASEAGFTSAVTTNGGIDLDLQANKMELKRLKISGKESFYAFKLRIMKGRRGANK